MTRSDRDMDFDWTQAKFADAVGQERTAGGALWVLVDGRRYCIPYSLIDDDSEVYRPGDEGELIIPWWLAEEKGMV